MALSQYWPNAASSGLIINMDLFKNKESMVWIGFVYKYKMYFWSIWKLFYYMLTKQLQNVPKFDEKIFKANWHFSFGQHQLRD